MKTIQFKLTLFLVLFGLCITSCVEDDEFDLPNTVIVQNPDIGDGQIVSINSIIGTIEQNDGENFVIEANLYV